MEEARTLDTADRYVNCKCVKYLFRIDEIDKAVETAGLFTRVCVKVCLFVFLKVGWLVQSGYQPPITLILHNHTV